MYNSVPINADTIHATIAANTTIRFQYFHYNLKPECEYSRKGEIFEVNPQSMLYDNDNYYLFSFVDGDFRIFHVDRMATVEQGTDERQGKEQFEKLDMPSFSKSTFCMYNGKEEHVEMVFHHRMIDIVIDKSG